MYLVVDLEATCCEYRKIKDKNEIIEFGIVACNKNGEFLSSYQSFVKPTINPRLSRFCKDLTGIKQEWIDSSNNLEHVLKEIKDWIIKISNVDIKNIPWTSFGTWDYLCFSNECLRYNKMIPFGRYIDLRKAYSSFRGCPLSGLREYLRMEGLDFEGEGHRAIIDALNASKIARVCHSVIIDSISVD